MSVAHRYANFGTYAASASDAADATEEEIEGAKLDSFEAGYQAGWDDAVKAQSNGDAKLTEDFVQNLQDISFTHHEAYTKLSAGMRPLLSTLISKFLPEIAAHGIVPQITHQLSELMDDAANRAIEIAVAPDKQKTIEQLLRSKLSVPFTVVAEPALSCGQVYLRVNKTEREINLDAVLAGAQSAIEAFFHTTEQEISSD